MLNYSGRLLTVLLTILWYQVSFAQTKDSLRYPITDRRGDVFSNPSKNPFDIRDTGLIKRKTEYDPKTKSFYISEKIGNSWYRKPTVLGMDELLKLESKRSENDYFKKRADALFLLNQK